MSAPPHILFAECGALACAIFLDFIQGSTPTPRPVCIGPCRRVETVKGTPTLELNQSFFQIGLDPCLSQWKENTFPIRGPPVDRQKPMQAFVPDWGSNITENKMTNNLPLRRDKHSHLQWLLAPSASHKTLGKPSLVKERGKFPGMLCMCSRKLLRPSETRICHSLTEHL